MTEQPLEPLLDPEVEASLPLAYLSVVRGVAAGEDDRTLAERAEVEVTAVPAMVRLALAKLLEVQHELRRRDTSEQEP